MALIGFITMMLGSSPAVAAPVDVTIATLIPPSFNAGIFPTIAAPEVGLGVVGINGATTLNLATGLGPALIGVGTCDASPWGGPNIGVGCSASIPFLNGAGAAVGLVECWVTSASSPFGTPAVFIAQDPDENGIIALGTDPVFGPIPINAGGGGTGVGNGGPFFFSHPVHVIVTFNTVVPATLLTTVACAAM